MANKMDDETCQLCRKYDTCIKTDSNGCQEYEFYKCENCVDRVIGNDKISRCFRGGTPCKNIRFCTSERSE